MGVDPHLDEAHMVTATGWEPFASFVIQWVTMMAAMMLPSVAPAVVARARATGRVRAAAQFVGAYLSVWALVGVMFYALFQAFGLLAPGMSAHGSHAHGSFTTGAAVIAAGIYELTPLKRYFRRACREKAQSGYEFGLNCVGSCIGLMAMLMALGFMSIGWMLMTTALVLSQRLLPTKDNIDIPLALEIIALGVLIVIASIVFPGPA
jgi:predicted metal-binding membrane protein